MKRSTATDAASAASSSDASATSISNALATSLGLLPACGATNRITSGSATQDARPCAMPRRAPSWWPIAWESPSVPLATPKYESHEPSCPRARTSRSSGAAMAAGSASRSCMIAVQLSLSVIGDERGDRTVSMAWSSARTPAHDPCLGWRAARQHGIHEHGTRGERSPCEQLLASRPRAGGSAAVAELRGGEGRRKRDVRQGCRVRRREQRTHRADLNPQRVQLLGRLHAIADAERSKPAGIDRGSPAHADDPVDSGTPGGCCCGDHDLVRGVRPELVDDHLQPPSGDRAQPIDELLVARHGRGDHGKAPRQRELVEHVAEKIAASGARPDAAGRRVAERAGRGAGHESPTQTSSSCV